MNRGKALLLFAMAGGFFGLAVSKAFGWSQALSVTIGVLLAAGGWLLVDRLLQQSSRRIRQEFETANRALRGLSNSEARARFVKGLEEGSSFEAVRSRSDSIQLPETIGRLLSEFLSMYASVAVVGTEVEIGRDHLASLHEGELTIGKTEEFGRVVWRYSGEEVIEIDSDGEEILRHPSVYHCLLSQIPGGQ